MKVRIVAAVLLLALAAGVAVLAHAGGGPAPYRPHIDPAAFTPVIDNPYLPLRRGTRLIYEGRTDEGLERKVVEVTDRTRVLMGVTCLEVHDTVTVDGRLSEDTLDWFAEDRDGTVWYFGEATQELEGGKVTSTEGSWESSVDGADLGDEEAGVAREQPIGSSRVERLRRKESEHDDPE